MATVRASVTGMSIRNVLDAAPCTLYKVKEEEPIISAGLHLSQLDVEGVVAIDRQGWPTGIIIGYNVLRITNPKSVWSTLYQTRIADSKMRVLLAKQHDDVQAIVRSILSNGWGYAIVVDSAGAPTNLIGLLDLAEFLVKSGFTAKVTNVRARDKASNPLISVSESLSVYATIQTMLDKHIRRLYIKESGLIVSDRGIIKWLLSPANLAKLRDSPREVLDVSVKDMGSMLHNTLLVDPDLDAASALKWIGKEDSRCLITSDKKMILTPWDLTVSLLAK